LHPAFKRWQPFGAIGRRPENPAILAHRYALSLDTDMLVVGVKNHRELAECIAAAAGPFPLDRSRTATISDCTPSSATRP